MNAPMTFEQFQATGVAWADMREHGVVCDYLYGNEEPVPGRIYAEDAFIEGNEAVGYCLTMGNDSHMGPLLQLERELYEWLVTGNWS